MGCFVISRLMRTKVEGSRKRRKIMMQGGLFCEQKVNEDQSGGW